MQHQAYSRCCHLSTYQIASLSISPRDMFLTTASCPSQQLERMLFFLYYFCMALRNSANLIHTDAALLKRPVSPAELMDDKHRDSRTN
jgi:hypothetical protein